MVVFTSVISFLLASSFSVSILEILLLCIGGLMVAGASNVLNQAIEREHDRLMKRTKNRPIAAGRINYSNGVLYAGMLSLIGISVLALFNPLTGFLGTLSLVTYAFVYTPLKRYSQVAVYIGAIPGAMPVLIGCVAFDGYISTLALILFVIQVLWQLPHFWAIGYLGFEDYRKAGFQFVPSANGKPGRTIMTQALIAALILLPVSIYLISFIGMHAISAGLLILTGLGFSYFAFRFFIKKDKATALALMFSSLIYLPLVLSIILIDQI